MIFRSHSAGNNPQREHFESENEGSKNNHNQNFEYLRSNMSHEYNRNTPEKPGKHESSVSGATKDTGDVGSGIVSGGMKRSKQPRVRQHSFSSSSSNSPPVTRPPAFRALTFPKHPDSSGTSDSKNRGAGAGAGGGVLPPAHPRKNNPNNLNSRDRRGSFPGRK